MHSPRSDEPIYWLLFGAGGMAVAMALPAVLVVLIVAGITSPDVSSGVLSFAHAKSILGCWIPALVLFGTIALVLWHAFHRIYHSLHDLTIRVTKLHWFVLYGGAAAFTFICFALQFVIYCKLF